MREQVVIMEPKDGKANFLNPVKFSQLGVRERQDLEQWLENNPEILRARLLIITTEFSHFDKSNKRLDILALDEDGRLVIIELKRDTAGSLADLQALRYAAFCANTTFEEVVALRAQYAGTTIDGTRREIRVFVEEPEFSALNSQPRIILAAGSFEDQELTSCVLWLRSFGVDITCIELAAYRLSGKKRLLLVPRVIIPLPEAEQYVVRMEKKEAKESGFTARQRLFIERNGQILRYFKALMPDRAPAQPSPRNYMQVRTGYSGIHYEWWHRKLRDRCLDIAVHFESSSPELNRDLCRYLRKRKTVIERKTGRGLIFQPRWTQGWSAVYLRKNRLTWNADIAKWGAQKMAAFIRAVQPLLDERMREHHPTTRTATAGK